MKGRSFYPVGGSAAGRASPVRPGRGSIMAVEDSGLSCGRTHQADLTLFLPHSKTPSPLPQDNCCVSSGS